MTTPTEAAQLVAEHVVGSCKRTVESALDDLKLDPSLRDDAAFCAALDGDVFFCDGCGWWCYQPDSGDWMCEDCAPEEED